MGLGTICLKEASDQNCSTRLNPPPRIFNLSHAPGFPFSSSDKRFYKMTVQIERTEMTTSDKRDTKLLSTVRAPSTQTPVCGGKYKADVKWKLNIVLSGWPQPLSELDLKQGQSAFIISSESFNSKGIPNRHILDLELGDAGQCAWGKGRIQRIKGELATRWTKRISSNHSYMQHSGS